MPSTFDIFTDLFNGIPLRINRDKNWNSFNSTFLLCRESKETWILLPLSSQHQKIEDSKTVMCFLNSHRLNQCANNKVLEISF